MKILSTMTTFQEVPNELSFCVCAYGCPLECKGCSWANETDYIEFSLEDMRTVLEKYKGGLITCVCFLGGDWNDDFNDYLLLCKNYGLKTCLYTGKDVFGEKKILENLDYLKYGHWDSELGGLDSKRTNQVFLNLKSGEKLNYYFWKD